MNRHTITSLLLSTLLLGLVACGGGHSDPAPVSAPVVEARALSYADPGGSGWRLVKDGSSTSTRLVLNLVGPSGLRTRGVGFNLQGVPGLKFVRFDNGLAIQDAGVYQLRQVGSDDPAEPVALVGGVKQGYLLSAGIYQKDRDQPAQDSGRILCRIALDLDGSQHLAAGTVLALSVVKARAIPEDIGTVTDDLWTLGQKMRMTDISIAVGTLKAE